MSGQREAEIRKWYQEQFTKLCACGWRIFKWHEDCVRCDLRKFNLRKRGIERLRTGQ